MSGTCLMPLGALAALRKHARRTEKGHVASAVIVATFSIAIGLRSAVSTRH